LLFVALVALVALVAVVSHVAYKHGQRKAGDHQGAYEFDDLLYDLLSSFSHSVVERLVCISSQTRQWHANGDQDTTQVRQ